jgi:hypothetical protein
MRGVLGLAIKQVLVAVLRYVNAIAFHKEIYNIPKLGMVFLAIEFAVVIVRYNS